MAGESSGNPEAKEEEFQSKSSSTLSHATERSKAIDIAPVLVPATPCVPNPQLIFFL